MADERPDRGNAHVRKPGRGQSQRDNPDTVAAEAAQLLDTPAFSRAYDGVRDALIKEIEDLQVDGGKADDDYERELCRSLRALKSVKRMLVVTVQGQQLRLAQGGPQVEGVENG